MTLSIAWTRKSGNHTELVFASDSRLRSYGSWDANPKIFQLERTDCAISFAGDTHYSYPLVAQIQSFVRSYPKSQSRFQDIHHFRGHLLNMMNHMLQQKSDYEAPGVRFLFGGYSWERTNFALWHIFYDKKSRQFVGPKVGSWRGIKQPRLISSIGDHRAIFRERLIGLMKSKKRFVTGHFDMEPFEVLRDMIREDTFDTIGGPLQLLKVYEHMNRSPISVRWEINGTFGSTLLGRPLLSYEKNFYPEIDPDSLEIEGGTIYG